MELARENAKLNAEKALMSICMLMQHPGLLSVAGIARCLEEAVEEADAAEELCRCSQDLTYSQVVENMYDLPLAAPMRDAFYPPKPSWMSIQVENLKKAFHCKIQVNVIKAHEA